MFQVIGYRTKDGETLRVELEQANTRQQAEAYVTKWLQRVNPSSWRIEIEQGN
jgi:hypothetical protein